jgi:glycosyltransferase involved in cell wall biosynthesis
MGSEVTHTTIPNVQYVTAIYKDASAATFNEILEVFMPFFSSKMKIIVYTDFEQLEEALFVPNIKVIKVPKEQLVVYKYTVFSLPEGRNIKKDTADYIQVGLSKAEFIHSTKLFVDADVYVWFDYDILKLATYRDRMIRRMERAIESLAVVQDKILIPGCVSKERINYDAIMKYPVWRFCGNFCIIPKSQVDNFFTHTVEFLDECEKQKALTWEFNMYAAIEKKHPDLFHWYSADHNDTIVQAPLPKSPKKIILLTMIKNESRIIRRMIESTLSMADAICVCDTGSTDNTVDVLKDYFTTFKVPTRVYNGPEHLWKNFGYNRSQSFLACVDFCKSLGWDAENVYALVLDADMELKPQPSFDKNDLTDIGYKMIQKTHSLEYYNTRFLKIAHPWKCTGVTHEYWDGGNTGTLTMDKIYISDIGDGGCKDDKFERDVRLLEEGLKESPNNPRYLFYLAQSYKDNKQLDKAIEYYKKRIDAGGWYEEIWYSMYTVMKLYAEKKQYPEMEMWGLKAYEYRKERAENILFLTRHFRDKGQHYKAWQYYLIGSQIPKPSDLLFVETDTYTKGFPGERAILNDYIYPQNKKESLSLSIEYYNTYTEYYAYTNIQHFVQPVPGTIRPFHFPDFDDYVATSTSFCRRAEGGYDVNVRYVNYRIQPNGGYLMMENGVLSGDNPVRTENYHCVMDDEFKMVGSLTKMQMLDVPLHNPRIKGLEDVRIFKRGDEMRYYATTLEYSYNGKIRQHTGRYNIEMHTYEDSKSLKPPTETDCEKNWIPYKGDRVIYGWSPFRIGRVNSENQLVIETTQETPKFLSNMRGSTTLVEDGGYFYGLTHCVMYQQPRKYYHMVIKIDAATDKIVEYTLPFFFVKNAIEYSLGFDKHGDTYHAIVSQNDRNPVLATFKDADVTWCKV